MKNLVLFASVMVAASFAACTSNSNQPAEAAAEVEAVAEEVVATVDSCCAAADSCCALADSCCAAAAESAE